MSREYPDRPIVGVGAVIIQQDRVLLIERGQAPLKGEWSLPGGALELGETLEEGIRREVLEETGLVVDPLAIVEVFDRISRDDQDRVQYHYVLVDYLCRVIGGELACATDAADARWATLDELGAIAPFTAEVIQKAFRMTSLYPRTSDLQYSSTDS
ncbi:MAG TPA: NUDIX hydrolase [Silvibacterium sp.]|nr:NUDIX hydrolase [Silvibacterium sp.]